MKTTTMVYAALFSIAMVAAYLTWTADPEPVQDDGSVVLIDAKPEQLEKVVYTSKDVNVTFEQKKDELGQYVWVSTTRRVEKKKPKNPHDPHAGIDDAVEDTTTEGDVEISKMAFKAGKAGDQLLEDLAPFRVARKLDVKESEAAEFGFDEPKGTLSVKTSTSPERSFEIGDTAYGHKHVYLRDAASKEVFVIQRSIVSPLERADTRLPEKELFPGEVSAIVRASVSTPSASTVLVQRNRDDAAKASWTTPNSDSANTSADAWLDKVFRLRSAGYLPASQKPEAEMVFAVKLEIDDSPPVTLKVMRGVDDKGGELWFASSEFTRGLVKLTSAIAADAAADVTTLFAAE